MIGVPRVPGTGEWKAKFLPKNPFYTRWFRTTKKLISKLFLGLQCVISDPKTRTLLRHLAAPDNFTKSGFDILGIFFFAILRLLTKVLRPNIKIPYSKWVKKSFWLTLGEFFLAENFDFSPFGALCRIHWERSVFPLFSHHFCWEPCKVHILLYYSRKMCI